MANDALGVCSCLPPHPCRGNSPGSSGSSFTVRLDPLPAQGLSKCCSFCLERGAHPSSSGRVSFIIYSFICSFTYLCLLLFQLHLQRMEVPEPGIVQSEPQLQQCQILNPLLQAGNWTCTSAATRAAIVRSSTHSQQQELQVSFSLGITRRVTPISRLPLILPTKQVPLQYIHDSPYFPPWEEWSQFNSYFDYSFNIYLSFPTYCQHPKGSTNFQGPSRIRALSRVPGPWKELDGWLEGWVGGRRGKWMDKVSSFHTLAPRMLEKVPGEYAVTVKSSV